MRGSATRRDFLLLATAGLFFTGDLSIWHWSLQFTSVANSTVLTNFAPIFVTLGAWAVFRERITPGFIIGMTVSLAGAVMLVGADFRVSGDHLRGDVLSLVAAVFYAGYLLTVKHLRRTFSSATIMAWSGLVSCPAFLVVAWGGGERIQPATWSGWLVLLALALICHVGGQTLIAYALGHLAAAFSALSLLWQPIVAAILAWMWLSEPLTLIQGIGGAVVLAGIVLGSRANR